ncbi:MAG: PQQ-binding-like beta-propeller repeat protein [Myxococcota bacterium]
MRTNCAALVVLVAAACTEPIGVEWRQALHAPSLSTPLVTDSFIVVGHEIGVSIFEPDGTPRCVFPTHRDVISAPVTDGKLIFFGCTNYIFYAIDSGCTEVWKFPTGDRIKSDPLVADGRVILTSYDGHVYALEAATGRQAWVFPRPPPMKLGTSVQPAPNKPEKPIKAKRRGRKRAGEKRPEAPEGPPKSPRKPVIPGDFSYSSPVLAGDKIFVGNLDHYMYVINAADGRYVGRFKTDGPVTSTPLIDDGVLYFGSNDGIVYAIDLGSNRERWRFSTKDWVNSSPSLANGVLFVGSNDRHVYAINATSGRVKWKFATEGPAIARPTFHENLVIAAGSSGDGTVYALQREDGTLFWSYRTGGKIDSDPVMKNGKLYVSSSDRFLYTFVFHRTRSE